MKLFRRCQRILILSLLFFSVVVPIIFVSSRFKHLSFAGPKEFAEDFVEYSMDHAYQISVLLCSAFFIPRKTMEILRKQFWIKYRTDNLKLQALQLESAEGLKEPGLVVYEENDLNSAVSYSSKEIHDSETSGNARNLTNILGGHRKEGNDDNGAVVFQFQQRETPYTSREKEQVNQTFKNDQVAHPLSHEALDNNIRKMRDMKNNEAVRHNQNLHSDLRKVTDEKLNEMKDQLVRAKAYLNLAPPGSNSHLVKELRLRVREIERVVDDATKDSDLSRSDLQKMRHMESSLSRASQVYCDCRAMATKLRAMAHSSEEQILAQKKQASYLVNLAARTTPKDLHCLSMRLTFEYFNLEPHEREFSNQQNLHDPKLYHFAIFSDNVLACAVVVNSTLSTTVEPEKIIFHVVTDSLNFPAISMWFLLNPPGKATIQVQNIDSFEWLSTKYDTTLRQNTSDLRYASELNHLRFYLPNVFPELNKILLLDHDVVVQRDLIGLWDVDLKGKVNGAVQTCQKSEASFRRMDSFINFSDPFVANKFDINKCTWAFGMNLFDLQEWRRHNLTPLYREYLQLGFKRPLWVAGTLPLGWVTFYNQTVVLDRKWHVLGLGSDSGVNRREIEHAAVIHYDGIMKPWLDIAIGRYKSYWSRYVNFDNPDLQQCNIHQ